MDEPSLATRNASGRLTPALTIEDRIRLNRSTSAYWMVLPSTGIASTNRSRA